MTDSASPGEPTGTGSAPDAPPLRDAAGSVTTADAPAAPMSASEAALARYGRRMRRQRLVYAALITAVVAVLGIVVVVAWNRGEVGNTALHTVRTAPPSVALENPTPNPQVAWRTTDRTATGTPLWGGTVVTFSAHTVRGRNALTGARTWSYTRSNRTVCTAAQAGGTTVAIYQVNGNCDEATALDSGTGARRWTRTLDKDGMPVNGHPTVQVLPFTVMITTSTVIYAIDPSGGLDRWTYTRNGCTIERAVIGTNGVLISQNCTHVRCGQLKFCGSGHQLLLRDAGAGTDDKSTTNPDRITWNKLGDTDLPVSGDLLVSALDPTTRALVVLDGRNGAVSGRITLSPQPATTDGVVTAIPANAAEVIWLGGVTYAVQDGRTTPLWSATTPAPPTVVSTTSGVDPSLSTARITVPTATGVRLLDGNTGRTAQAFSIPAPPAGSLVHALGTGFLVAEPNGSVAYR